MPDTDSLHILSKHTWLVILHASRIPPHVGIIIHGNYNSLTIKGHELNVSVEALLKTIRQKKIESVFYQLKKHPVFSQEYLLEVFQHHIAQFDYVKQNHATCLSPVKLFFDEFYAMPKLNNELLFEMVQRLEDNHYIENTLMIHVDDKSVKNGKFNLPNYSSETLHEVIKKERSAYYTD